MATIYDLLKQGVLRVYTLPPWEKRMPIRELYLTSDFEAWVAGKAELSDGKHAIGRRTLVEHMDGLLADYCCSERPAAGGLRRVQPTKHGVWKLHPPKLRLYGWAPRVDGFVVAFGELEADTKADKRLNDRRRDDVRQFIKSRGLQNHIVLGDINDIVS